MDIVTAQVWPLFGMGMLAGAALAVAWLQRRRIGVEEAHRRAIVEVERARQRQASAKARIAVLQTRNAA